MPSTHPPYAPEYRRRIIELARAGRSMGFWLVGSGCDSPGLLTKTPYCSSVISAPTAANQILRFCWQMATARLASR